MIPLHDQNPTRRFPFVTIALIAVCVLAFLWQVGLGERALHREILGLGAIPALLTGDARLPPELYQVPAAVTLITSLFLHGGWFHLIGNMLYLWVFGNNIEDVLGHFRFTAFYLLCGVLATFAHVLNDPASQIPLIGASGAISGVLGAYIILYPHARVLTLIPIFIIFWTIRLLVRDAAFQRPCGRRRRRGRLLGPYRRVRGRHPAAVPVQAGAVRNAAETLGTLMHRYADGRSAASRMKRFRAVRYRIAITTIVTGNRTIMNATAKIQTNKVRNRDPRLSRLVNASTVVRNQRAPKKPETASVANPR